MRTWGRVGQVNGVGGTWVEVTPDASGGLSNIYITTLVQSLRLSLGESPFFANYGIPAQQSVVTQVMPDFYASQTQTQFAPYFASLTIQRVSGSGSQVYRVRAVCPSGAILIREVAT